jgi:aldose 1-epimerase
VSADLQLAVGDHAIVLDIEGDGRATSWRFDGEELLGGPSSDPVEHGMYAMGPWAGRLRDNALRVDGHRIDMPATYGDWALHGTVIGRPCRVIAHEQGSSHASAVVEVDLGPTWPWPGALRAHWRLEAAELRTRLALIAPRDAYPGVIGWHPWFRRELRGASARWSVDDALLAERQDDYRLTGQFTRPDREPGTFDDAFRGTGYASLCWPGVLEVAIDSSAPWFVVFDMLPGYLCIEPQSGPPNGVNDGLGDPIGRALPDQPLVLDTVWRLTRAPRRG